MSVIPSGITIGDIKVAIMIVIFAVIVIIGFCAESKERQSDKQDTSTKDGGGTK